MSADDEPREIAREESIQRMVRAISPNIPSDKPRESLAQQYMRVGHKEKCGVMGGEPCDCSPDSDEPEIQADREGFLFVCPGEPEVPCDLRKGHTGKHISWIGKVRIGDVLERVAVYFDHFYGDAPELNPAGYIRQAAYELQCWRMLANGEIPERMTAEQYAFSQRLNNEDE